MRSGKKAFAAALAVCMLAIAMNGLPVLRTLPGRIEKGITLLESSRKSNEAAGHTEITSLIPKKRNNTMSVAIRGRKVSSVPARLRNDGTPGRAKWDFLAIQKKYNLSLIPTYDGSNQATHPKLLYFPQGWNGYRYWMSFTPYPNTNADYENPSLVVSNDGKTWLVPKGLKNPITGVPKDVKFGGHYSDSQLVMRGDIMELWYRVNYGNQKTKVTRYNLDEYYRITSTDGIHWSKQERMQSSPKGMMSLAAEYRDDGYRFWYTDYAHRLMHAVSRDGKRWEKQEVCSIPLPKGLQPWHQDVVRCNNRYYLLQTTLDPVGYNFSLYLSESSDGIHFSSAVPFIPSSNRIVQSHAWMYRSTFAQVGDKFSMVISYRLPGNKWFMTQCTLSTAQWDAACRQGKGVLLDASGKVSLEKPAKLIELRRAPNSGNKTAKRISSKKDIRGNGVAAIRA